MATYENTVNDPSITVSIGSPSLSAGDTVSMIKFSIAYTSGGDLSATDLLLFQINQECECSFESANGGQLKLTLNRTSTGTFINRGKGRRTDLFSTSSSGVIYKIQQHAIWPLYLNTLKCAGGLWCVGVGRVYIAGDVDVTTINVESNGRCTYYKTTGGFAATTINNYGEILIQNDFGTLNQIDGTATIDDVSVTPTTITCTGGTLVIKDCGTIGAMTLKNCVIDWSQMKHDVTVSPTTTVGPGVTIIYKRGGIQPTWTLSNDAGPPKIITVD